MFKGGTSCNLFFYRPLPRYHFYLLILYIGILNGALPINIDSAAGSPKVVNESFASPNSSSSNDDVLMRGFGKIVRLLVFYKYPACTYLFPFLTTLLSQMPQQRASEGFYGQSVNMKFITRELEKYPKSLAHTLMQGHFYLMNRSFQDALGTKYYLFIRKILLYILFLLLLGLYLQAYKLDPTNALTCLLLAVTFQSRSMQRVTLHRQYQFLQAGAFLQKYQALKGCRPAPGDQVTASRQDMQEVYYNMGRFFHHYCLLKYALHFYEKALNYCDSSSTPNNEQLEDTVKTDLRLEIAHNLHLLYLQSGNLLMAHAIFLKYSFL